MVLLLNKYIGAGIKPAPIILLTIHIQNLHGRKFYTGVKSAQVVCKICTGGGAKIAHNNIINNRDIDRAHEKIFV